jgi:hypothetical protein
MNEREIAEAIAEQEEHIKRQTSCGGVIGRSHRWDRFAAKPGMYYEACWRCRVTRTSEDHRIKLGIER